MDGIINVFKDKGMTSHDVVRRLRKILSTRKVGHTGTLDPNVTGVIPICVGKGTKASKYILEGDKEYICELTLGTKTTTQDSEGDILKTSFFKGDEEDIHKVFNNYCGKIQQLPPMYSAVKCNGKKLYELAREGKDVQREKRPVIIYNLKIMDIKENKVLFYIHCSKGTYVRTICNDIGDELGCYGYMSHLIRISVEQFKIEDSFDLESIENMTRNNDLSYLLPIDYALSKLDKIIIDKKHEIDLKNGMKVPVKKFKETSKSIENSEYRIYIENDFIGIGSYFVNDSECFCKINKLLSKR